MALCVMSCVSSYAVRATISAPESETLRPPDVQRIRGIVRELAQDQHLMAIEHPNALEDPERAEIRDTYLTAGGPSLDIVLWIPKDRSLARIQVNDWDSVGEPSARQRAIEERLRRSLEAELPGRSVRFEDKALGSWAP